MREGGRAHLSEEIQSQRVMTLFPTLNAHSCSKTRYDPSAIATITVTYNPDPVLLRVQLEALPAESLKVLVDNASEPDAVGYIATLAERFPNTLLLYNERNLGLAGAINLGFRAVCEKSPTTTLVLLLDQDTEPHPGSIRALVEGFKALEARGERVGGVGPLLLDVGTGLSHGFHQATRWRWRRVYPPSGSIKAVPCANLNGSGTLMPIDLFRRLGGLDEELFIDHVDTEWSFRVLAAGYGLWGIPTAEFAHRMGESSVRFWMLRWHVWPSRQPLRHYFLYRNAVLLMRRPYVPRVWKFWASFKLALTAIVHGIFDPERRSQWQQMWKGLREGLILNSLRQPNSRQP